MHRPLLALLSIALIAGCAAERSNTPSLSAPQVLRRVARTYASCRSYRDTGTVASAIRSEGHTYRFSLRFQTAFARPDRFRFEYNTDKDSVGGPMRHIIWTSGGKAYTWWTLDRKVSEEESLDAAVAGATGVSSMSAHVVPRLLMPDKITGWTETDLKSPKLLGSESVGSVDCLRIEGAGPKAWQVRVTLWVGKQDYLIRKVIVRSKRLVEARVTTLYQPERNINLPASAFESGVGR